MKILSIPKSDLKRLGYIFLRKIGIFIVFIFVLFFDGTYFAENYINSQIPINILMFIGFILMYLRAVKKIRKFMIYAVIIGFLGEYFFSIILEMYSYRLQKVPLYVPFGHAALYGRVLIFSKDSFVKKYENEVIQFFFLLILLISFVYLTFLNDVFGFLMSLLVYFVFYFNKKTRLFFLTMYLIVVFLEIGGTAFGAWKWPSVAFGVFDFLPSNNPPSGISIVYFLLDISCFLTYVLLHQKIWKRYKCIKLKK